jgi:class 3 adenylate cyclase
LAVAIFVGLGRVANAPGTSLLYVSAFLVAGGSMGFGTSQVVRRLLEGEIGRSTLERFLAPQVMRGAYGDPLSLLAEPRVVEATVLVSDLRDFTAFSESVSPVEVLTFLNEIQSEFAAAVRSNGGIIDKFMGDGMLAVFGAPVTQLDHASRAVQAARDIRVALTRVNEGRSLRNLPAVACGIGIHSGPVVTGCVGTGAHLEFTVLGDTVNTAARLEALTKERGLDVILSGETVARTAGGMGGGFPSLGEVSLRGRRESVRIHGLAEGRGGPPGALGGPISVSG